MYGEGKRIPHGVRDELEWIHTTVGWLRRRHPTHSSSIKKFKKQIIFSKKSFQSPKSGVEKRPWGIKGGALSFSARKRPLFIIDRDNCFKLKQKIKKIPKNPKKIIKKPKNQKKDQKKVEKTTPIPPPSCHPKDVISEIRETKNREYIQKQLNQEKRDLPAIVWIQTIFPD